LSLPHGLNNQGHSLDFLSANKSSVHLSEIHWKLLPDWFIEGINHEILPERHFSIIVEQLKWRHEKEVLKLPLACDWEIKNHPSHWKKRQVPLLLFRGKLDFKQAQLSTSMSLSDLANSLDFSF
jgi:hypothetical protein